MNAVSKQKFVKGKEGGPPAFLALLRYRHRLVRMRTMVKNGLQAVALNHQLRLGFRLFTVRGQQQFAALPLSGAYATQRQQAQVLLTTRSEEHTSELQSRLHLVCRLLLEKKK